MSNLRIVICGFFIANTYFFSKPALAEFENELGAGLRVCATAQQTNVAFSGAAAEMAAECAQKVGVSVINDVGGGVKNTAATGMAMSKCTWSPVDCASEVAGAARRFVDLMSQSVDKVTLQLNTVDPSQAAAIACELITSAAARNVLKSGTPAILSGITSSLEKFAILGKTALNLQKLGVPLDKVLSMDPATMTEIEGLSPVAQTIFAHEVKMCSL